MRVDLRGHHLACERDERELFKGFELNVVDGVMLRIEGPNGSGKTSLLKMLSGQLLPASGKLEWHGRALSRVRESYLSALLYIGHTPGVGESLTAQENLEWSAALAGLRASSAAINQALANVALYGFEDVAASQLSAGQQRRIALARLELIARPLWILDEPFTALDREGVAWLEQRLLAHRDAGGAVIMTTHHAFRADDGVQTIRLGAPHDEA